MTRPPRDDMDDPLGPRGPYDPDPEADEAEHWFLPPEPTEMAEGPLPFTPALAPATGDRLSHWAAAEGAQAAALARAALALGALDERVRHAGPGLRRRLVLREAADLCWHLGARVTVDRLALHLADRLTVAQAAGEALDLAAQAVRRLEAGGALDTARIAAFLGLREGERLPPDAADWVETLARADGLHPITRGARAWASWRRAGLSGDAPPVDGAVAAARIGSAALRPGGLGFVPVALAGPGALRTTGTAQERLAAWYAAVEQAALAGLMEADRIALWHADATRRLDDLTGRTPPRLVAALIDQPLASVPTLAAATGASRAAVQRNIAAMEARGLVAEVTGQTRFRYWRIAWPGSPRSAAM